MATIDLGKIKLVWRGTYAGGTAYTVDDVVQHTDGGITSSFICTTNSTGNAPSTGGSVHGSWAYLAKGAAGSVLTTQGDILYRDGSGDQRLAKGTGLQQLRMNSGATAPEWATITSGGLVKLHSVTISSATNNVNFDATYVNDTYDNYLITWTGVSPSTAGDEIAIVMSADGGSSFPSHDGMFMWHEVRATNSNGTSGNLNYLPCGGDADEVIGNGSNSGYYYLFNLRSTTEWKHAVGQSITYNVGNAPYSYDNFGNAETTSAINYIRFYDVNSNNLDAGIITLYGIAK
tara:strand:- start:53 stop:919 length:867 start_codon:yes stop_codon:yes gene_type:complete